MNPIEVTGIHKSFKTRVVLRGIDLTVAPGELVGLVGPNGSGKTTCLRILLGIVRQDSGTTRVLGMDPSRDAVRIRQHCSYLPGETSMYHRMRGKEFLHFALSFYPNLQDELMEQLMETFTLPLQKKVRAYSAGMKQQLALMATLIPNVELYLLDEPDRALDATTRFFLRGILRHLHDAGKTILLSSHHLREVEAITDRLVFVMDGTTIPEERVAAARAILRRRVRLQVHPDTDLPDGAEEIHRDRDGTIHVEPRGDPIAWLARVPADRLVSAEVGTVKLEDLYRLLTERENPVESTP